MQRFRVEYKNGFEIISHEDVFEAMKWLTWRYRRAPISDMTLVPIKIERIIEPKEAADVKT
jgi:hypothetical protein